MPEVKMNTHKTPIAYILANNPALYKYFLESLIVIAMQTVF